MNYLTLENVTKSYGNKVLFKDITLHIDKGQKIALVAKNGTGKTTLMRVLAGMEGSEGEAAKIVISKEIRTGFLMQDPPLDEKNTAIDEIFNAENPSIRAVRDYEKALLNPDDLDTLHETMARMDDLKAWDFEITIKEILSKLKIDDFSNQRISTLSGGQKKRIALAKMLIDEPDFLILDEPTNHLDLDMIEWLENYLKQSTLTLFMVTHDRYFLDAVADSILELENGRFYRYKGNYASYLEQKAARVENEAINLEKNRQLFKKELEWMRRQPQARGTKAKSRIDDFYDLKDKVSGKKETEGLQIDIKTTWLGSKILELHNVGKAYGEKKLVSNFSYKFKKRERVGIVGPNGYGKSTLLGLFTQSVTPDTGKVIMGETIVFGHYTQSGMQLKEDKRVIEVIQDIAEFIPLEKGLKITAATLLERFLFSREQQQVYVSQLSGGEKRRLYLLTILMKNPNFLILDEPTNDLDIVTLNVLEDFLSEYNGCLVIVTHDRYFMDNLVDHLFILEGEGNIRDYNGNYSEYRELRKEEERANNRLEKAEKQAEKQAAVNKNILSQAERKEWQGLEKQIGKLETKKAEITNKFNDAASMSAEQIKNLSQELEKINQEIEEKEMRWLELSELV